MQKARDLLQSIFRFFRLDGAGGAACGMSVSAVAKAGVPLWVAKDWRERCGSR